MTTPYTPTWPQAGGAGGTALQAHVPVPPLNIFLTSSHRASTAPPPHKASIRPNKVLFSALGQAVLCPAPRQSRNPGSADQEQG